MAVVGRHVHRAPRSRLVLLTVAVSCLTAVALAVGCRSVIVNQLTPTADSAPVAAGLPSLTDTPSTTAGVSTTELSPSPTSAEPAPTTATTTSKPATAAAPPPAPAPQPGSLPDVAQALLDQINAWRAADGIAPLTMASGLVASAHKHNLVMAAGCGMSHQCPGEAGLGARISAEGISWRAVAENVGWSGPISSSGVLAAAKGLNESMHNETPPNDGHRRNMLNETYHRVGIDVIRDADGKVWLTEDFAN